MFGQVTTLTGKNDIDPEVIKNNFIKNSIEYLAIIQEGIDFISTLTFITNMHGITSGDSISNYDETTIKKLHVQLGIYCNDDNGIRTIEKHVYHPKIETAKGFYIANIGLIKVSTLLKTSV